MASPPIEQNGGESAVGHALRSFSLVFLNKTYQLVDDAAIDDIIFWNDHGSTFTLWNPAGFVKDLLRLKYNNFCSFVRQFNTHVIVIKRSGFPYFATRAMAFRYRFLISLGPPTKDPALQVSAL